MKQAARFERFSSGALTLLALRRPPYEASGMDLGRRTFLGGALGLAACGTGFKPPAERPAAAARRAAFVDRIGSLELHSGFWMNLHHYLYARAATGDEEVEGARRLEHDADPLSARDQEAWAKALAFYGRAYGKKNLLFDDTLERIKDALAREESEADLRLAPEDTELVSILRSVEKSYEARAWPKHDRENRTWIESVKPLLVAHGPALEPRLTQIFHAEWPPGVTRVDVCVVSCWEGAYTSIGPVHITISSADERNQGSDALEIVMHETSHGMIRPVRDAIHAEAERIGKPEPPNLWHAILFYSTGFAVQERIASHVPYAEKNGLWDRAWPRYRPALGGVWQRYLDGTETYESAITALVREVSA